MSLSDDLKTISYAALSSVGIDATYDVFGSSDTPFSIKCFLDLSGYQQEYSGAPSIMIEGMAYVHSNDVPSPVMDDKITIDSEVWRVIQVTGKGSDGLWRLRISRDPRPTFQGR